MFSHGQYLLRFSTGPAPVIPGMLGAGIFLVWMRHGKGFDAAGISDDWIWDGPAIIDR